MKDNTMRRVQYHRYGGPDVLALDDVDTPTPSRGQVLVRVRAAAANAMDWKMRNGDMRAITGRKFPRAVGHEFAGVVAALGDGVTRFRVGDEVLGGALFKQAGAFADYVLANERAVTPKPDGLTFNEAATLPVAGLTAYQALTRASNLQQGQDLFINGCLGGVGRIAVQVATGLGAHVAGSCRSGSEAYAHQIGVETVVAFDLDSAPLAGRFDVVLDTAGILSYATARRMLKPSGKIIDIVPSVAKFARSILPGPYTAFMGQPDADDLQRVAGAAARGDIAVRIHRTVSLADAIPALTELENTPTSSAGKLVITTE